MKLRSLQNIHNLHHISTIKGGKVVKILNVTRGRPKLSYKEIHTILDHGSNTKALPLANRSLHEVFRINPVKSEEEIVNDNYIGGSSDNRSHDLDDTFHGEMTLKQLKEKCKAKNHKVPRSADKKMKQEYGGSNPEEDNLDLEETLGSLKRKVSRKSKSMKMLMRGPQPKTIDVVKCELVSIDEDSLQVDGGMSAIIKVEVSEPEFSPFQEVTSSEDLCSGEHEIVSTGKVIGEMQVTGESCTEEEDSLITMEGPKLSNAHPHSYEHTTAQSLPISEEMMKVDDLGIIEKVTSELPDPVCCLPREESSLIAEEYRVCTLNQNCLELEEHSGGSYLSPESFNHEEAVKVNDPVKAVEGPIIMPILTQEDKAITDALTCNESPDVLFPLGNESAWNDNCTTYSRENKGQMHRSMFPVPDDQAICMAASSHTQPVESSSDGEACPAMGGNKEFIILGSLCTSANSPSSGLNAKRLDLDSMVETDKVSRSFASENVECFELQHPPERLLSARKTISPDSQQKLCRAMNALDLPDYQKTEKCKQRICFEKQEVNADTSSNIGEDQVLTSSTVLEHSTTADTSPNSKQKMIKGKEDKKRVRAKGVNKIPPPTWYRLSSACGCIQSCSQNVIDFSQQQMTDIDRLALNLTKELRSMKEIMIEMLQPQVRRATTSRFNLNEVRVAVENATRVEDMARRCLSTMTRDCNRFCKIVSLAEKNAAESVGNSPNKEEAENDAGSVENRPDQDEEADKNDASNNTANRPRKKIKFADESGGSLCNVRFIEDRDSMMLDSSIDNGQLHSA